SESESKVWVKPDRLFEKLLGLQRSVTKHVRTVSVKVRLNVKLISIWILRRHAIDARLFVGRKLGLQLVGDSFGDFALDREDISHVAIIGLRPQVRVIARIDQLRVDAHAIARALNASFYHIRDSQLQRDLPHIACNSA